MSRKHSDEKIEEFMKFLVASFMQATDVEPGKERPDTIETFLEPVLAEEHNQTGLTAAAFGGCILTAHMFLPVALRILQHSRENKDFVSLSVAADMHRAVDIALAETFEAGRDGDYEFLYLYQRVMQNLVDVFTDITETLLDGDKEERNGQAEEGGQEKNGATEGVEKSLETFEKTFLRHIGIDRDTTRS